MNHQDQLVQQNAAEASSSLETAHHVNDQARLLEEMVAEPRSLVGVSMPRKASTKHSKS
ncbi:MAG: hypothetical protein PHI06_09285 [Desulfobulbaceae bacterium]|nr:hypothetical protein [Desulfobulbaceae bacterium]